MLQEDSPPLPTHTSSCPKIRLMLNPRYVSISLAGELNFQRSLSPVCWMEVQVKTAQFGEKGQTLD